jgi:hypothetical protein
MGMGRAAKQALLGNERDGSLAKLRSYCAYFWLTKASNPPTGFTIRRDVSVRFSTWFFWTDRRLVFSSGVCPRHER